MYICIFKYDLNDWRSDDDDWDRARGAQGHTADQETTPTDGATN